MHESSLTESVVCGLERLLESGGTDTELGCEAEVQSDRGGGGTDSTSERKGEATTVRGTGVASASVSVREAAQDRSLWLGEEESEGRGLEFNSVCEVMHVG